MLKPHLFFVTTVLMLLSACDHWPPNEAKAREHFAENRQSFERLAEKMRATDYYRVSMRNDGNVDVMPTADSGDFEQFVIDDDPEWHDLLIDVGMVMVLRRSESSVSANPGGLWGWKENQQGESGFTNDPRMLDEFKLCRPEFKQVACGYCAVSIEDDWYLHYIWYSEYLIKKANDAYLKGEITLDERSTSWAKDMRQCEIDGAEAMGYNVQEVIDRWDRSGRNWN